MRSDARLVGHAEGKEKEEKAIRPERERERERTEVLCEFHRVSKKHREIFSHFEVQFE